MSNIDGTIVFVERGYSGERVAAGDVWLCSVRFQNTVYNAMPLKKITSSMIMGLSDEIRETVIDSLWKSNRKEFEKIFEERFREEMYQRAVKEIKETDRAIIDGLQAKVADLEKQVEHSRMVIGQMAAGPEEGIVLTSDPVVEGEETLDPVPAPRPEPQAERPQGHWMGSQAVHAPGMPEMRFGEQPPSTVQHRSYRVERTGEETIRCDEFEDGKYFVHINPSKRFLVIRNHDYGSAICVGGRIRLEGLGSYASFSGTCQLMAEYNPRYDGVLVYL